MGKLSIWQRFKNIVAAIGFKMFLWGNDTCEEKYWDEIYEQEKAFRNQSYECDM